MIVQNERPLQRREARTSDAGQDGIFFENNPTPMWVYDETTLDILDVNKAAIEKFGYSRAEFLSMTIKDIRPPKDVPAVLKLIEQHRGQPASSQGIWCHQKKDGTPVDVEIISSPLTFRDRTARLVQALDVTELRQTEEALRESEARYRAVVEFVPYGTIVSVEGKLVYVNPAAVRLLGVKRAEELVGRQILDFVHEDFRKVVQDRREAILRTGLPALPLEEKLTIHDRVLEVEAMGVLIVYDGKPAILTTFRDITEYKRQREAIQTIIKATAGSGENFFRGLVAELAKALDVKYAFVGALLPGMPERVRSIAIWADGAVAPNVEYDLAGTPCAHVFGGGLCYYPKDVQSTFPQDKLLVEMGAVSYLGIPLLDTSGKAIGLLSVMDTRPMPNSDLAQSLMTIFGARVALELQRQHAEEALRQSEARYRTLFESAQDAIYVMEGDRILDCNSSALQMFGYSREAVVGGRFGKIPIRKVSPVLQPDGTKSVDKAREKMRAALAGIPQFFEWRAHRLDGTEFDVDVGLNRFFVDGRTMLLAIVRDITERKWATGLLAAEKRILESIAGHTQLPEVLNEICRSVEELCPCVLLSILLFDPDGKRLWPAAAPTLPERWTKAITPLMIGPVAGSCGTSAFRKEQVVVSDIMTDPLWTAYPELLALALESGLRACWSTPILAADGQLLGTFAMYYQEPRNPQPKDLEIIEEVTHLASVAIEHYRAVEGRRRAQNELERRVEERTAELVRANERLEELDRLKSRFLASMSHELRTPLNSIIGFTGIMRQGFAGPINDEQRKQLGLVSGAAKHLLSLINDLLDLSRIEAGKVDIEHKPFNFVDVVTDVIESLKPMSSQKNLKFTSELPGPVIEMVGDRKRCFQVLLNLANNAVKFTPRGEVKINVRTEGDKLRVCVADTGIGIKPEQMGMLFEAFRQLDGSAKRMYEGTGLGLHLCRRLLSLMKGEISVESTFGKGSRFTFTLPLGV